MFFYNIQWNVLQASTASQAPSKSTPLLWATYKRLSPNLARTETFWFSLVYKKEKVITLSFAEGGFMWVDKYCN